ncbi:transcription factor SRM1-like [Gastrolobium bilobum]|uniref:transcription factor SRM1-like n=1 Tax=Gastrolobium bilobum TaxID=150636 RepID=UPI002AAFA78D|nr:transcription factor SRM1-like [Gastrolobium bilobum]
MSQLAQQENNANAAMTRWTREDDIAFEDALAIIPTGMPEPEYWEKVAALVPGKSPTEVRNYYWVLVHGLFEIESGRVPLPHLLLVPMEANGGNYEKKRLPWTEEEHKLFLAGLQIIGKGDWKNIARYFVKTKNAAQIASHAQKYFLHLAQGAQKKERKRTSIHDITLNAEIDIVIPADDVQMLQHLPKLQQAHE